MKLVIKCLAPASFVSQRSPINTKETESERNCVAEINAFEALKLLWGNRKMRKSHSLP